MTDIQIKKLSIDNEDNRIKYIYQMSDIQIQLHLKHKEYEEVFENLYNFLKQDIKNKKNCIMVICGDILHSKTELSSNCVDITSRFLKNLANILPIFIIMGEHDSGTSVNNGLETEQHEILDALTPIINNIVHEKIFYMKETGFYNFKNITFGVTSIYNNNNILKADKIKTSKIKEYFIALYHKKNKINSKEIENIINEFGGYQYVFIGGDHSYKHLNEEKTICSSGSLICQNYKESLEKHGIVKWNIETGKSEHIEIQNEYSYHIIDIKNGEIKDKQIKKLSKNPRLLLRIDNTDNEIILKIIKKISKKYNIKEITKIYTNTNIEEREKVENDNTSIETIDKNIKNLLNKNKTLEKKDRKSIIEIHKKTYESIKDCGEESILVERKNWKLKEMIFSNMFSYGEDNYIDFSDKQTVLGIVGANGYGKSSIIDTILYGLFEKCSRGEKKGDIMNDSKNNFYIYLRFDIKKEKYFILRSGVNTNKGFRTNVKFWKEKDGIIEQLNEGDKNKTNKIIKSYVGEYEDFVGTSVSLDRNTNNFTDLTQAKRKDFLHQLLRLDLYEKLYNKANEEKKILVPKEKYLKNQVDNLNIDIIKKSIEEFNDNIDLNNKKLKKYCKKKKEIENEINKKEKKLIKKTGNSDIDYNNINIKEIKYEKKNIIKMLENLKISKEELNNDISEIKKNIKEQIKQFNNINITNLKLVKIKEIPNYLEKKIEKLNDVIIKIEKNMNIINDNCKLEKLIEKDMEIKKKIKKNEKEGKIIYTDFIKIENELKRDTNELENYKNILQQIQSKKNKDISLQKDIQKRKSLNMEVEQSKKLENNLKTHKYNPKCEYCVDNDFVKDAIKAKKKLPKLITRLDYLNDEIQIKEEELSKLNTIEDDYKEYLNLKKNCQANRNYFNSLVDNIIYYGNIYLEINESYVKNQADICRETKNMIYSEATKQGLIEEKKSIETNIIILKKIKKQIFDLELIENYEIGKIDNKLTATETNLSNINEKLLLAESLGDSISYCENIKQLKVEKEGLESKIKKIEEKQNNDKINKKLEENKLGQVEKLYNEYTQTKDLLKHYKIYNEYVGKNGLPTKLLKKFIPVVENEVNNILNNICQFTISLKLEKAETGGRLNKINQLDQIDFNIIENGRTRNARNASGFERSIINICFRVVICKLSTTMKPNILIIDEMLSTMDSRNKNNISILFEYLKTQFDLIIIISHLEELKSSVDKTIIVQKENSMSKILNVAGCNRKILKNIKKKLKNEVED